MESHDYPSYPPALQPTAKKGMSLNGIESQFPSAFYPCREPLDKDWERGLFGCGLKDFCLSLFCPSISYGRNRSRYRYLTYGGIPHPTGGEGCGPDGVLHCATHALCGCSWVLQYLARGEYRNRYQIKGSSVGDCLTALFCSPCELAQESYQIEVAERRREGVMQQPLMPELPMSYPSSIN
ncbi:hypothetical protein BT69DRAFT_790886 [Atractiella rhizophila]|nr:hypothetical protein BT69DRAFT_790886 [Atractiella rhizophila]